MYIIPRDKSLGYYQMSLRDKVINIDIFVKLTFMRMFGMEWWSDAPRESLAGEEFNY
jgi:hypothetical protein